MSLVGPRPERPHFVQQLAETIPFYQLRHVVKPGLTGWAQINYGYANTFEHTVEKLQYDLFYIKNISCILDAMIIFETVKTVLVRKGS
jgi:lipopolysaccharide/colanic/teichoic acid biosynthesis glycosyltransferase